VRALLDLMNDGGALAAARRKRLPPLTGARSAKVESLLRFERAPTIESRARFNDQAAA
jgi:hypothetical protein